MATKVKVQQTEAYKLLAKDFGARLSIALYGTAQHEVKGNYNIQKDFEIKLRDECASLTKTRNGVVSVWLSGEQLPSLMSLCSIAQILNVSVDWLLGRSDDKFSHYSQSEKERIAEAERKERMEYLAGKLDAIEKQKRELVEVETVLQQELNSYYY